MAKRPPPKPKPDAPDKGALVLALFRHMHAGGSVRSYAKQIGRDESTVREWCEAPEYAPHYARAREAQGEAHVEDIPDVLRKVESGELDPQAARVIIDAKKWLASKFYHKLYGDKQTHAHEGGVTVRVEYADDDE